jgi:hypothetical protein
MEKRRGFIFKHSNASSGEVQRRYSCAWVILSCLLAFFSLLPFRTARAEGAPTDSIGLVIALEGNVFAQRGGADVPLSLKSPVFLADTVGTGPNGRVQMLLDDESAITMGPDSRLELREFAQAGKESAFAADLSHGAMRLITGLITEANPKGFRITTPLAIVGVRGTILVIEADERHTTVRVLNSDKTVLVNGIAVAEYFKITVRKEGAPEISPLTAAEREAAEYRLVLPVDGEAAASFSAGDLSLAEGTAGAAHLAADTGGLFTDMQEHPLTEAVPAMAQVSGNIHTDGTMTPVFAGFFSFDLDLSTGNISNATLWGSGMPSGYYTGRIGAEFYGGTGTADNTGFNIDFPVTADAVVRDPTGTPTFWPGRAEIGNLNPSPYDIFAEPNGASIGIKYAIFDDTITSYDTGTGTGALTK